MLVITPADYTAVVAEHGSLQELGTICYPAGRPRGKLKVIAANGNILTVSLLGTMQTYQFNVVTDTFGCGADRPGHATRAALNRARADLTPPQGSSAGRWRR